MNPIFKPVFAGGLLAFAAGAAQAEMLATTATDITVYSGPGAEYPAVGIATRGSAGSLDGCLDGENWCRIDVNGMRGWVYAEQLTVDYNGAPVVVQQHRSDLAVPVVSYEQTGSVATPAPGDELIGRVDDGVVVTPPAEVRTYIDTTTVETVPFEGDLVVGATLPPGVTVAEVPNYRYSYVRLNDRPVLVDPQTRRVVYVYD
ncbi:MULTISPECIES: DUF1236 domain-containing protein [unclassified Rhizobium]|uniref:DUF1236 domain-containing protein n=1 Tax=unclassified Rhizobium TaxID=2613769 RepID=UPI000701B0E6|nr:MULTISPECIES: DUF1236 domain-containing protein [unclassified Rhizobium]KQV34630.1 hypothetical protein ASC86_13955 [Rhizobium sp. Root1212]KRD23964.1 hypothetical protein ASE37_13950 [Rhizobium sp. Root268]